MRRFFRFSIRDLLWLTLVVALALGWFIRDRQLRAKADQAADLASKWRMAAGGLEKALQLGGWKSVMLDFTTSEARLSGDGKSPLPELFAPGGESPFVHDRTLTIPFCEPTTPSKE